MCWAVFLLPSAVLAGEYNPVLDIGDAAPQWMNLPGTDDKEHSFEDLEGKQAIVVVFTCNSCPYAVDYEDRLIAIAEKFAANNVALVAINVNKVEEDLLPAMKERAAEKKFNFAYLFDETQQTARAYGATYTPEVFLLNHERQVVYMGALDDSADLKKVKKRYLESAIAATLKDQMPEVQETVAIGCRIRLERQRRRKK